MTTQSLEHVHIGAHPLIEALQIYTAAQADAFQRIWQREIDFLRFEWVTLPDAPEKTLALDLALRSANGQHNLIVIGTQVNNDGIHFPSLLQNWPVDDIAHLRDAILAEMANPARNYEIRALHPAPRLTVAEMTTERVLPGMRDYTTAVNHIKRYTFLLDHIRPGKILECACGTGYGAAILSRLGAVQAYRGVDLSDIAVAAARGNMWDERFSFHADDLATPTPCLYENVISLETIEHIPNPYRFMEHLIDKMAPGGQLLLSLPAETWGGSHMNPYHLSNWNRNRLTNFLAQYFEDVTLYAQRLSLLGPSTFEASEIASGDPDEDCDECFVCILRRPKKNRRPALVLKRSAALGDVIWITPILRSLRRLYPQHNLIAVTQKTDVLMRNPDVDLVFSQYEPMPDDLVIDLDGAYESRRPLHLLHAYAKAVGIPTVSTQPALYPTPGESRHCAALVLDRFQPRNINRLVAVHMAATSPNRIWPKTYWQQLIADLLQQNDALGIIVLGDGKDFSAADIGLDSARVLCLVRRLNLMRTAATLALCDLLIAPDSGVLHIAAAVGVPYLGLFGMADPATRLPLSAGSRALWAKIECRGCLQTLPADAIPLCPLKHADCMERILPADVLTATAEMLTATLPNRWITRCRLAHPQDLAATGESPEAQAVSAFRSHEYKRARKLFSNLLETDAKNPLPPAYLAFICAEEGQIQEAETLIAQAMHLAPQRADLNAALGETFLKTGHSDLAAKHLRQAIAEQPDLWAAYPALARSLLLERQGEEAVALLDAAANVDSPASHPIRHVLIDLLAQRGDLDGLTRAIQRFSTTLDDDLLAAHGLACTDHSGEQLIATLEKIQDRLAAAFPDCFQDAAPSTRTATDTPSPLHIAFLISDLAREARLGRLAALLEHLPTQEYVTTVLTNDIRILGPVGPGSHDLNLLLTDHLRIDNLDDPTALRYLHALAPDILIDLDAYSPRERLSLFTQARVPHKLLWGETPLPPLLPQCRTLAGAELGVEGQLPCVLLPGIGEIHAFPALPFTAKNAPVRSHPVFACLSPVNRINDEGWRLFAAVLDACPDASLLLNPGMLERAAEDAVRARFARAAISPQRLRFAHIHNTEELCRTWQQADAGLAPPLDGGDPALPAALWMGKPCIALASNLPWARRSAALLHKLDAAQWIAESAEHYIELARQIPPRCPLPPDPALRAHMQALGLANPAAFAQGVADALHTLAEITQ
ncbi:MAG: methyltransferase domain-containing protein [Azoarcus sp.]|nr:methyltransferase domain-containing protein [Azoarcus sp.]